MGALTFSSQLVAESEKGELRPVAQWVDDGGGSVSFDPSDLLLAATRPRASVHVVREDLDGRVGVAIGGRVLSEGSEAGRSLPLLATLPALYPEWLGNRLFGETHGVRFPYVSGEMANGIASTRMVAAMASAEMLGFFGAAGLSPARVQEALRELRGAIDAHRSWGVNMIHSPQEPALEDEIADLLIREKVPCVSASAFMRITPAVVRCAVAGLRIGQNGRIERARYLFAKVSRTEVAEQFLSPPPAQMLTSMVSRSLITEDEARLAARLPLAEDITVEADSGGHTDNRPLTVLLPAMLALRASVQARNPTFPSIRIGAAGGIGTPSAVAAAFALGADYVLVGSVNQSAVEAGLSEEAKEMLAKADYADVAMAPSADMFELGVKVQVLKRGTLFAARASRLYETYVRHESLEAIPKESRSRLEAEVFLKPLEEAWADAREFWRARDERVVRQADSDAKLRMALTFRSYLGLSSKWPITGEGTRKADYQIWCGPSMGSFNRWVAGSFLEDLSERSVVQIARNLMEGAAVVTRAQQLRSHGVPVPGEAFDYRPRPLD
jgi:trans-AT polyketide synthase, acyltransferase and oxidoreductase domains